MKAWVNKKKIILTPDLLILSTIIIQIQWFETFLVALIVTQRGGPAHNTFPPGVYSQASSEEHRTLPGQNSLGEFGHLQPCRDGGVCAALQRGAEQGEDDGKTGGMEVFKLRAVQLRE